MKVDPSAVVKCGSIVLNKAVIAMQEDYTPGGMNCRLPRTLPPPSDLDDLMKKMMMTPNWVKDVSFAEMLMNLLNTPPRPCFAAYMLNYFDFWEPVLSTAVARQTRSNQFDEQNPVQLYYSKYDTAYKRRVFGPSDSKGPITEMSVSTMHRVLAYAIALSKTPSDAGKTIRLCSTRNPNMFEFVERTLLDMAKYLAVDL